MTTKLSDKFISPSCGPLTLSRVIGEVVDFVDQDPNGFYRLVIGTDSQTKRKNGSPEIDFVTAIVVHRAGKGARYFWKRMKNPAIFMGRKKNVNGILLRDKIYTETMISLDVAQNIVPEIRNLISPAKYDLEIHIDVGPLGPTREMIREVVGMVAGNGFTAKTKPESWGASSVADRHA